MITTKEQLYEEFILKFPVKKRGEGCKIERWIQDELKISREEAIRIKLKFEKDRDS